MLWLTMAAVLDPTPIPHSQLADAGDETLRADLADYVKVNPDDCYYRLIELDLSELTAQPPAPEDWLLDGDEDSYELACELELAYSQGVDVTPIIVRASLTSPGMFEMLDGYHRLSGAHTAGRQRIRAHELITAQP